MTVQSDDGSFRLTIEPAVVDSPLDYFAEEMDAEQAGEIVERPSPIAVLERIGADGQYQPVWARPLLNPVAPVEVLLAGDGSRIVTFDNWHSVGRGEHVIVIYDGSGQVIRSMSLNELLPEGYIEALPRSVSSVQWRSGARISDDGAWLLLDILVPSLDDGPRETVERVIDLHDGTAVPAEGDRWRRASQRAQARLAMLREQEARKIAYLTAPLEVPPATDEREWHAYLREAYDRLTPDYLDMPVAATKVLFDPASPRFRESLDRLVEAFVDDEDFPGDIAVASPASAEALIMALDEASAAVRPGALAGGSIYVSVDQDHRAEAERLVARTGARFVWLDPAGRIAQRPERVPGSPAKAAADEERMRLEAVRLDELLSEIDGS